LNRVIAVGVSEDEAKLAITSAIADRKIRVRVTVKSDAAPLMRWNRTVAEAKGLGSGPNNPVPAAECFEGANIGVPIHLTPHDFDWQNSRPLKPWQIRPRDSRSTEGRTFVLPRRTVRLIEVSIADITRLIDEVTKSAHGGIVGESASSASRDHAVARSTPSMSRDDAAGNATSSLDRGGVPAPARKKARKKTATERERARRVIKELYPAGVPGQATLPNKLLCGLVGKKIDLPVSDDTILRAAGRRK
jgi:hypothetical protein